MVGQTSNDKSQEKEIKVMNYILQVSTKITFYNGVHEIGGNKFLVEDRGTKIFLDFGMQILNCKSKNFLIV